MVLISGLLSSATFQYTKCTKFSDRISSIHFGTQCRQTQAGGRNKSDMTFLPITMSGKWNGMLTILSTMLPVRSLIKFDGDVPSLALREGENFCGSSELLPCIARGFYLFT